MAKNRKYQSLTEGALVIGICLIVSIIGQYLYATWDMTEDKRHSLAAKTTQMLDQVTDKVTVQVLLDGEFPAGFKRLQRAMEDLMQEMNRRNSNIEYYFEDPSAGSVADVNARKQALSEQEIYPVNLRLLEGDEKTEKLIYPYAIIHKGQQRRVINLLENDIPGQSPDVALNRSISLLEYKVMNAISQMSMSTLRPLVFYTQGHAELDPRELADLNVTLNEFYSTAFVNLDTVPLIPDIVDVIIVPRPRLAFSDREKFTLDQYIMNGGHVLWLIDKTNMADDSLMTNGKFVPADYQLNLDDMFFKYGARIQPNIIADLECSRIPLAVGKVGDAPQFELKDWFYHLVITPAIKHPIVQNLDPINMMYASTIDSIQTVSPVHKTPLLQTSAYTRTQFLPTTIDINFARVEPDPDKFNKGRQTVSLLLEGHFPSYFQNQVTPEMAQSWQQLGGTYKKESEPTSMIIISDGSIAQNGYDFQRKKIQPLGYNRYERFQFGNKDFLLNAIEYLLGNKSMIAARSKEVKLRLLDATRIDEEKNYWQLLNIGLPIVLLTVFGLLYTTLRKRKYTRRS